MWVCVLMNPAATLLAFRKTPCTSVALPIIRHRSRRRPGTSDAGKAGAILNFTLLALGVFAGFPSGLAAQTVLPFGPLSFSLNADYDGNFKEAAPYTGISRHASGYLQLFGSPTGLAVFDTSSTGGTSGLGGTGGSNANNDLSDFIISADLAGSGVGSIWGGFLLRLNDSEANGYVAAVRTISPSSVNFSVGRGTSLASAGTQVFTRTVALSSLTLTPDTFYNFTVAIQAGVFSFDFANGQATASFTDPVPLTLTGQAGIVLSTASPFESSRLDNFTIRQIPEPRVLLCVALGGMVIFLHRKCRSRPPTGCPPHAPCLARSRPGTPGRLALFSRIR
jgi:hypothetical protein